MNHVKDIFSIILFLKDSSSKNIYNKVDIGKVKLSIIGEIKNCHCIICIITFIQRKHFRRVELTTIENNINKLNRKLSLI